MRGLVCHDLNEILGKCWAYVDVTMGGDLGGFFG